MLLVIGYSTEGTIAYTLSQFRQRNIEYDFLDLLKFCSAERIRVEGSASELTVDVDDQVFHLSRYSAIYQRCRFHSLGEGSRSKMLSQFLALLYSFLSCTKALVVNRPCTGSDNHNKFLQVRALKTFGFAVPEQAIIGDGTIAGQVLTFDGTWVNKGCSAFKTSAALVDREIARRFVSLGWCPSLFQQRIVGPDVRVHVVGNECHAVTIRSSSLDYRFPSAGEAPRFEPAEAPGLLRLQCLSWARANSLLFAGFDFKICGNTGEWFLLEVNPMPGYDMFDRYLAGAISTALIDLLSANRRAELPGKIESFISSERRHSIKLRRTQNGPAPNGGSSTAQRSEQVKSLSSGSPAALIRPGYAEVHEVLSSLTARNEAEIAQEAMAAYWLKGFRPAQAVCDSAMESAHRRDWETIRDLMNPDWIEASTLVSSRSINEGLVDEILSHPRLGPSPAINATRGGGRRLTGLQSLQSDRFRVLFEDLQRQIEAYIEKHRTDTRHPVNLFKPRAWTLHSWALVMGGTAFQDWHIHPGSWLSGAYYASIPSKTEHNWDRVPGSIDFGLFPPYEGVSDAPKTSYCPEPGLMLLFPSYFCHRTWPTNADANRICISFDLVPDYR